MSFPVSRSVVCAFLVLVLALGATLLVDTAKAEVRTATANDGVDSTVLHDIEQVRVRFDRDVNRIDVTVRLHRPLGPAGSTTDRFGWIAVGVYGKLGLDDKCASYASVAGDTSVRVGESGYGSAAAYEATTNVSFRLEYAKSSPAVSADRREVTVSIVDSLYQQFNPRCLTVSASGRGLYDPSQPGGGSSYDAVDTVFFDGYGPPAACENGRDDDYDTLPDLADPGCLGDPEQTKEDNAVPVCRDGRDNDYDGRTDVDDPGCLGDPQQTNEDNAIAPVPECRDGRDNDADTLIDVADPNCNGDSNAWSESAPLALARMTPEMMTAVERHARKIVGSRLGSRWTAARRRSIRCAAAGPAMSCRVRGTLRRGPIRLTVTLTPSAAPRRAELAYVLAGTLPARNCRRHCARTIGWRGALPVGATMLRSTGMPPDPASTGSHGSGGSVHVDGYYRKDGTYVRPHTRRPPS